MDDDKRGERMTAFARSFPCLKNAPGVDPFEPHELNRWAAGGVSHGERVTARFILAVYDSSTDWEGGRFDLMEAIRVWDPSHHAAFLEWVEDPWWP